MLAITRYAIKNQCLAPWIKFIWHFDVEDADIHNKLLPTDCIDIILNLSGEMIYQTNCDKIVAPPFHINGLRSQHSYIHQKGNIRILGISFYPYGLYPFVHKSLAGINDRIVDLFELAPPLAKKLALAVSTGSTTESIIETIEKALCMELKINNSSIKKLCLIRDFLEADSDITIKSFSLKHNIHTKTFMRNVLYYTGYTPKILCEIKRFQEAGNELVRQNQKQLASIAYDNGFADQAHFAREFKKFSGSAPRVFQQEKITIKENAEYNYR